MSETNPTEPDHYADILGMNLWELVKPLSFIEGNVLKYIWRAGLKEGVSAKEDYAKALKYLSRVNYAEELQLPVDFFDDVPMDALSDIAIGAKNSQELSANKASMLYHFLSLLWYRDFTEKRAGTFRMFHYNALTEILQTLTQDPHS